MKLVPVDQTELTVPEIAKMAKQETVILTQNGKPLAAVKDLSGTDWESVSLANDPKFIAIIEASRRSYRKSGSTSLRDLRSDLGLKSKSGKPVARKRRKKS